MTGFIRLHTITGGVTLLPVGDIAAVVNGTPKKGAPKASGARRVREDEEEHAISRNGHLRPRYQSKGDWSSPAVIELRDGTELAVTETVEQVERLLEQQSEHGRMVRLVLKAATMLGDDPVREPRPDWLYELHGGGKYWLDTFVRGEWKEVDEATFLKRVDVRAARLLLRERK